MIAEFIDSDTGTPVYINPDHVMTVRPDPVDPLNVTIVKLRDGETIRVRKSHADVADKLADRSTTVA